MEEKQGKPANQINRKKRLVTLILVAVLIAVGAIALYLYRGYVATHISTDDAFVDGRVHVVASKVPGTVNSLRVTDNQSIKKGDLLLEVDPIDYDVRVREAMAALDAERTRLSELRDKVTTVKKQLDEMVASLEAARANFELQEANYRQAEIDFKRSDLLMQKQVIPREQHDRARTAYDVGAAQVKAAREQIKRIQASLETQQALIKQTEAALPPHLALIQQKEASLKAAELSKGYTRIYAPADGFVTKRSVEVGNQIQAGQPLMSVVPLDQKDVWITANYKETQLKSVRPGQRVRIKVDTYPGKVFDGKVESIMAGTGAVFSLFPPENATGNYVKVVQRVPVKITVEAGADPQHLLRIGMSVVPTILVER